MLKEKLIPRVFKNGTDHIVEGSRVSYICEGGESGTGTLIYVDDFKVSTDTGKIIEIGGKGIFVNTIKLIKKEAVVQ